MSSTDAHTPTRTLRRHRPPRPLLGQPSRQLLRNRDGARLRLGARTARADDLDVQHLFAEWIAAFGGVDAVVHTTADTAGTSSP